MTFLTIPRVGVAEKGFIGSQSTTHHLTVIQTQAESHRYPLELAAFILGDKSTWFLVHMPPRQDGIVQYDKVNKEWTMGSREDARDFAEDGDYVWAATWNQGITRFVDT